MPTPLTVAARILGRAAVWVVAWAVVAAPVALLTFSHSSRTTIVAGHEATVSPTFDGWAQADLGPFLPGVRYPTGGRVGAAVEMGRTPLTSYDALTQRYAAIAAQPEGQIDKVRSVVAEMARDAALVGALAGLVAPGVWLLLGQRRRRELLASRRRAGAAAGVTVLALALVCLVVVRPWDQRSGVIATTWLPVTEALPDVPVPTEARALEVDAGLLSTGTRRLVESALSSYRTSSRFYSDAAAEAADLSGVRLPGEGETVGVLVSDRHDNIGMDPVARAIGDAAGATFLLDAGDDTSTGSSWEAFSLESLDEAFAGLEQRWFVAGNHDNGSFVTDQAADLGFTALAGEVVEGPGGSTLLGVADPRASGLGNWRDETGLSFAEVGTRLAEVACGADGGRVSTILVHDANLAREALDRGCVDLVVAGHLHVVRGPLEVAGPNGERGWSFTTGTTGGAAYAIALGTKPRRDATVALLTYREGRPVGVQWVQLSPLGDFTVGSYVPLDESG